MPGLKIKIDTTEAVSASNRLKEGLKDLGHSAKENERATEKTKRSHGELTRVLNSTRLETAKLQRGLGDYSGALRTMVAGNDRAISGLKNMAGALSLATAAGGYAVKRNLELTAEMQKQAQIAGLTIEAYQELTYVGDKYKITQDAITDGMKELNLRAEEFVVTGAGSGKEAFERLNYSQAELNKKLADAPALLKEIIGKMQDMETASKMRLADEIFGGEGGEQFVAMIDGGADALEKFTKEAHDLGLVLDRETAEGAIKAHKAVALLEKQLGNQFTRVVAELAPDLGTAAEGMGDWVAANKVFLTQDVPGHIRSMAGEVKDFLSSKEYKLISEYWELMAGAAIGFKFGGGIGAVLGAGAGGWVSVYRDLKGLADDQIKQVKMLAAEYDLLGQTIERMSLGGGASKEELDALEAQREEIKAKIESIKAATKAQKEHTGLVDKTTDSQGKLAGKVNETAGAIQSVVDITRDELELMHDLINAQGEVARSWYDTDRQTYHNSNNSAVQAAQEYYDNWRKGLKKTNKAHEKAIEDRAAAEEKAAEQTARVWEHVTGNIHDIFADTIYDMTQDGIDSFSDFFDRVGDMFLQLMSQMTAKAITTDIMIPIAGDLETHWKGAE